MTVERSKIRDRSLAPSGHRKIDWAAAHMPVLRAIAEEHKETKPLAGRRVGISLHLEAKTACLALTLQALGAKVAITGSNPLSTQDDVAAALAERGVIVRAWHNTTAAEYRGFLQDVASFAPHLLIDDGGDLVSLMHSAETTLTRDVLGGCEETTTGVLRLRAMERDGVLRFPMIAVNNAKMKYLFDNRHGTGQSAWDGIMRSTNLLVAGKTVVVIGYGWCGRGVAQRAKGLGARVVVVEVDPFVANEALLEGFQVMPGLEAAAVGDIFVTATGNRAVLRREHFQRMRDGAILANAGHFDVEIWKPDLYALGGEPETVRNNVQAFRLQDGRTLYLLAEGRLVNLAAADGHPAEIMDMTFALQTLSLLYLNEHAKELGPRVVDVPREMDERVARLRLSTAGAGLDELTPEQQQYLASWQGE